MKFGKFEKVEYRDSYYPFVKMKPGESVKVELEDGESHLLYEKVRAAAYRAGLKLSGKFKTKLFKSDNYIRVWRIK